MPRVRSSGEGALYFDKTRKLWIGVIDNGLTPEGKRQQIRVTSKSQTKARDKLRAKKDEIENNHGSPLGSETVSEWATYWLESVCKPKMKPAPFRTYQSVLTTWILPTIGRKKVKDVLPSDLRRVYDNMRKEGKSSSTALKAHTVMSSMFEAARLDRKTKTNVANDIRPPKAAKSIRNALTPDQTRSVLEVASSHPDGSKWGVSLYAGIRQGERLGATLDSVDFTRGLFTVQWNLVEANYEHGCDGVCGAKAAGWCPSKRLVIPEGMDYRILKGRYMLVPPKSGESRTFPLPVSLLRSLDTWVRALAAQPNPHGLLWPAVDGSPISGREDQAQWRALLVEAGVENMAVTTHWARHTAISDMAAAGVPDRVTGEIVGHKSAGVTGGYQHVSSKDAAEGMEKLAERRQLEAPS